MTGQVYVSIGNSDDKLSQARWSNFVEQVEGNLSMCVMHGAWYSAPQSPYQNACWCIEPPSSPQRLAALKRTLARLAREFGQDSIAWADASTSFLEAGEG